MEITVNYKQYLRNGDRVNILTSKNSSPSLHWIPTTKTGKARAAIRRYWHDKGEQKEEKTKNITLHFGFHYLINPVNLVI